MSTDTALPPVKPSLEGEIAYYAKALSAGETMKWISVGLACVIALLVLQNRQLSRAVLHQQPLVVRVSDVGRAEAVSLQNTQYLPHDTETRYFINKFVSGFWSRNHRLTERDYPESLAYLSPTKLAAVQEENRKNKWYATFMNSNSDDMDVVVKNITLDMGSKPYRAHVDFEKVWSNSAGIEEKREGWGCEMAFLVDDTLAVRNNDYVRVNPLGFQITDFRPAQAFVTISNGK